MSVDLEYKQQRRLRRLRRQVRRVYTAVAVMAVVTVIVAAVTLIGRQREVRVEAHIRDVQAEVAALDWVDKELLPLNEYSRPGTPLKKINAVVVHYVGNPGTTAAQNRTYYARLAENHETSVSSNFLIGLRGEIIQCVPVNEVAYCSNQRNGDTISVECCHPDKTGKFNEATYESLVKLTAWLLKELELDSSDVIRHYDVSGKECPKYYVDHEDAWEAFKDDVQAALDAYSSSP